MPQNSNIHTYWDEATSSAIGQTLVADISDGTLPLLTTRKIAWRSIVYELLWFTTGSQSIDYLQFYKVHIWDKNASNQSWNARNLGMRPSPNYIGPSYGYQWRYGIFGDQLSACVYNLIHYPCSRRILMCSWTPESVHKTVLPPCHFTVQFLVKDDSLHTVVYMRSGDLILGIPFNIVSYSLLANIIATLLDIKPGTVTIMIGDAHVYADHMYSYVNTQQNREILPPPKYDISWLKTRFNRYTPLSDIALFWDNLHKYDEVIIAGLREYACHDHIKYEMVNTSLIN